MSTVAEHGDSDAPQLPLLQTAARGGRQEPPGEVSLRLTCSLADEQGLGELYQDARWQAADLIEILLHQLGDGGRVAQGVLDFREELQCAVVERVLAQDQPHQLLGLAELTERERLLGSAQVAQQRMARMGRQNTEDTNLVSVQDRRRASFLSHDADNRRDSLAL